MTRCLNCIWLPAPLVCLLGLILQSCIRLPSYTRLNIIFFPNYSPQITHTLHSVSLVLQILKTPNYKHVDFSGSSNGPNHGALPSTRGVTSNDCDGQHCYGVIISSTHPNLRFYVSTQCPFSTPLSSNCSSRGEYRLMSLERINIQRFVFRRHHLRRHRAAKCEHDKDDHRVF